MKETEALETKKGGFKEFIKELLTFSILAMIIVLPIRAFVANPFIVSGASMFPTFETGDYLIIDQLTYRFKEPQRGDVIVFRPPNDESKFYIKRVIALPKETIKIEGKQIYITTPQGEEFKLEEPYITLTKDNFQVTKLNETEYFVMGDNRLESLDSRSWGPLEHDSIVGRAIIRLLPLSKIEIKPGHI